MNLAEALAWLVPGTLAASLACPERCRPAVLLMASYLFLALWHLPGLTVLLFVTTLTYVSGRLVEARQSRVAVGCCLAAILLPLCIAKLLGPQVTDFGLSSFKQRGFDLVAPFGLSFFTLQAVGYVLDVHRDRVPAERRWIPLALYLAFFPKLLAGPIERAGAFTRQLDALRLAGSREAIYAGKCILLGLFVKLVVANSLAASGEQIMKAEGVGGAVVALACVTYSYEIYLDFFAYSLVAIGVAELFGIALSENFHTPYSARTLQEFWRRWHMTLSFWFRDYLYRPLGGRQLLWGQRSALLTLVFICSALWHGSAWTFVAWGALHAVLYLFGASTLAWRRRVWAAIRLTRVPRVHAGLQRAFVFVAVTVGWVFFRSPSVAAAVDTLGRAFGLARGAEYWSMGTIEASATLLTSGLLIAIALMDHSGLLEAFPRWEPSGWFTRAGELLAIDGMILVLLLLGTGTTSFTYFRF